MSEQWYSGTWRSYPLRKCAQPLSVPSCKDVIRHEIRILGRATPQIRGGTYAYVNIPRLKDLPRTFTASDLSLFEDPLIVVPLFCLETVHHITIFISPLCSTRQIRVLTFARWTIIFHVLRDWPVSFMLYDTSLYQSCFARQTFIFHDPQSGSPHDLVAPWISLLPSRYWFPLQDASPSRSWFLTRSHQSSGSPFLMTFPYVFLYWFNEVTPCVSRW